MSFMSSNMPRTLTVPNAGIKILSARSALTQREDRPKNSKDQQLTRLSPIHLLSKRRKQAITRQVPHLHKRAVDRLRETRVVADLCDERAGGDVERDAAVGELEAEELAVLRCQEEEGADGEVFVHEGHVAEEGHGGRDGDGREAPPLRCGLGVLFLGGHGGLLVRREALGGREYGRLDWTGPKSYKKVRSGRRRP